MVAGLVLVGGAVAVLRVPQEPDQPSPKPVPPPQTRVQEFVGQDVVVPAPGAKPPPPGKLVAEPGPQRVQLWWGAVVAGLPEPRGAAGYEVTWGRSGTTEFERLVAEPAVQLDALDNNTEYDVQVRTVDSFGQRSEPAEISVTAREDPDDPPWSFNDRFTSRVVPDPVNWRFASSSDCGRATRGEGEDGRRLIVSAQCGTDPVALRARPPLRLADQPANGELGRFVVDTDHPGQDGALLLDFVPGPADLVDGSPNGSPDPGTTGLAQDDPSLPPGTVRVRIASRGTTTTTQVLVAPGTTRLGAPVGARAAPPTLIGISVRWEVVFRVDGVQVLRDGVVVGGGDVVPAWREATALLGFVGGSSGLYAGVSLAGFVGAPTVKPVLVVPPAVKVDRVVVRPEEPLRTDPAGAKISGVLGGQLRITLVPQNAPNENATDEFSVEVGGTRFPARPAVAGQPLTRGVRYPIVADVPPEALVLRPDGKSIAVRVRGPVRRGTAETRVISASLELTAPPGAVSPASGSGTEVPLTRTKAAVARPSATFLDAGGKPLAEGDAVPRGRLVLEVRADGQGGQRLGGRLAGMAGVEVRLDGQRIAGIPTMVDGPGTGGTWRLGVVTNGLAPGKHTIEVKVVSANGTSAPAVSFWPFTVD